MSGDPIQVQQVQSGKNSSWVFALVLVFLAGWTGFVSLGYLVTVSLLEPNLMTTVRPQADWRWLFTLLLGIVIGLPGLPVWVLGKKTHLGRIGKALFLAGGLAAVQCVGRVVSVQDSQLGMLLQLLGIFFFLILLLIGERLNGRILPVPLAGGLGLALLCAGVIGLPWARMALGSQLDTLLALAVGLAAGSAIALILQPILRRSEGETYSYRAFFVDGLAAAMILLPVSAALGSNGSGAMLALMAPWFGWVVAGISRSRQAGAQSNWPVLGVLLGLVFFFPLALIDLEELSIYLGMDGALAWGWRSTFESMLLCLIIVLLSLAAVRRGRRTGIVGWALAVMVWGLLSFLYVRQNHAEVFYGERLFVILKDQADLTTTQKIADPIQRRTEVYRLLTEHAKRSQAGLRSALTLRGVSFTPYYLVNAIEVQEEPLVRFWLLTRPEVDRVLIDTRIRPVGFPSLLPNLHEFVPPTEPGWNLKMIGAERVWNELGITGQGILIGQSDSGVDGGHPELAGSYQRRSSGDDYSWYDPWFGSSAPMDYGEHGTHTLGTVLGQHFGVAPGAHWIGCVNLARNLGNPAFYLDCLQFQLAPFPQRGDPFKDGRPEWGAQILNNSWGCPPLEGCDPQSLQPAVRALRAAGVFVVVSAGNEGEQGCGTIAEPLALYPEVTSVGAVDEAGNLAPFSSLGPVTVDGSNRQKPNLVAPGVEILSSEPRDSSGIMSGTSMAGPHVVGVVALMWSANPRLIGDVSKTEEILQQTAVPSKGDIPDACGKQNAQGYGLVNAYEAVRAAQALK